jgi:hypothetical protein
MLDLGHEYGAKPPRDISLLMSQFLCRNTIRKWANVTFLQLAQGNTNGDTLSHTLRASHSNESRISDVNLRVLKTAYGWMIRSKTMFVTQGTFCTIS